MFPKTYLHGAGLVALILSVAACGAGPAPNDVSQGVGFSDYQAYQARRDALRVPVAAPLPAPQTALPPADVTAEPFAPAPVATASSTWIPLEPAPATVSTPTAAPASTNVTQIASAAIAEAEASATAEAAPLPMTAGAENFSAPPLPDTMSVVGVQVAAFAINTRHGVGERMWSRFPLRLGRAEVTCADFRTTDLAQDWFLSNDGPERDRAGLDPDGDGFVCNWTPNRYRAQAQATSAPQSIAPTSAIATSTLSDG